MRLHSWHIVYGVLPAHSIRKSLQCWQENTWVVWHLAIHVFPKGTPLLSGILILSVLVQEVHGNIQSVLYIALEAKILVPDKWQHPCSVRVHIRPHMTPPAHITCKSSTHGVISYGRKLVFTANPLAADKWQYPWSFWAHIRLYMAHPAHMACTPASPSLLLGDADRHHDPCPNIVHICLNMALPAETAGRNSTCSDAHTTEARLLISCAEHSSTKQHRMASRCPPMCVHLALSLTCRQEAHLCQKFEGVLSCNLSVSE